MEAVGTGIALDGGTAAVAGLAEALLRLRDDPSDRAGARRIAEEIAGLPPVAEPVPLLEAIARDGVRTAGTAVPPES